MTEDRFKFRYWSQMCHCFFVNHKNEKDDKSGCLGIFEDILKDNDFIVSQCTGLRDKNGKLIYEGDILKQPDGIIDYVYWSDGCYLHNGTAITNYDICYQGDSWAKEVNTHEVIGNIYENKELIEVEE